MKVVPLRLFRFWTEPPPPPPVEPLGEAPDDRGQLATAAKTLLEDPIFRFALDRLEQRFISTWRLSAIGALQEREAAYNLYAAVQELRAELQRLAANRLSDRP